MSNNDESGKPLTDARLHHYVFAHMVLRGFCEADPKNFFQVMNSEGQQDSINALWENVCSQCDSRGRADFDIAELEASSVTVNGYQGVLFVMPEAVAPAEAIMVLVLGENADDEYSDLSSTGGFRYFLLELGIDFEQNKRTVFCEWSKGRHLNYGRGCDPIAEEFVNFVSDYLSTEL